MRNVLKLKILLMGLGIIILENALYNYFLKDYMPISFIDILGVIAFSVGAGFGGWLITSIIIAVLAKEKRVEKEASIIKIYAILPIVYFVFASINNFS